MGRGRTDVEVDVEGIYKCRGGYVEVEWMRRWRVCGGGGDVEVSQL